MIGPITLQGEAANSSNSLDLKTAANDDRVLDDNSPYRIGIISINAGEAILHDLACKPGLKAARFVSLDSRLPSLPPGTDVAFIKIGKWVHDSIGHRALRTLSHEQLRKACSAVAGLYVVYVIVTLGQPCELENTLLITETLKARRIRVFSIAILPFTHSRYPALEPAVADFKRLSRCLADFDLSPKDLLLRLSNDQGVGVSIERSDELWIQITCVPSDDAPETVEKIICAASTPVNSETTLGYDVADLVPSLTGIEGGSSRWWVSDGAGGSVLAVDRTFTHPLLGSDVLVNACGRVFVIEPRIPGEKMWIASEAMTLENDAICNRRRVIFSRIIDTDLPTSYRLSILARDFDYPGRKR